MAQTLVTIDELVDMAQGLGIFPQAAARIQEAANDPRASDVNLAKAIQIDPMATARLLKLSNSAALGGARHITDIREAITRLGYHAAKNLAIALVMGDKMIQQQPLGRHLWEHSVRTGIALSCLARFIRHVHTPSALTAGLLHDVGLVAMTTLHPDFAKVVNIHKDGSPAQAAAERMYFGVTHAELSAAMLQAWGLPEDVVTLVKMHHHGAPDPLGVTIEVAEEIAQPGLRTDRDLDRLMQHHAVQYLRLTPGQVRIALGTFNERVHELRDL